MPAGCFIIPRRLPVLDALEFEERVLQGPQDWRLQRTNKWLSVGGGDSAFDAAVMALERNAEVDVLVREDVPLAKSRYGGTCTSSRAAAYTWAAEVAKAWYEGGEIALGHDSDEPGNSRADYIIVQIGFLSAKETFQRLDLRLNEDSSIAVDPVLRNQPPWHLCGRRRPRRYQTRDGGLGRGNSGSHLRLQGNHKSLLAQRESACATKR